ncbi:uncharacterized protein LOC132469674 [Gadus macrocephalus]|uniref:uncharacterized protein LOC132469674 n=1 Tax=Gadus macrocephalus TaxID=80720 RepID=UPI0028CB3E84|nr:uncharacterized protein LOC132469674 [Gadus macrocephalus]XP_059923652.1 uncharacterized protein LOC132469674 [Gadus macrocephalus]
MTPTRVRVLAIAYLYWRNRQRWQRRRASCWTRQFLAKRLEFGAYHRLVQELRLGDGDAFKNFFRLPKLMFDSVLSVVGPKIARQDTTYRQAISPAERLAICLRYLATGDSYKSLGYSFRVGVSTISRIVPEVANAIWDGFVSTHMQMPKEEEWRAIAEEFEKEWDFPNCIGAIDGKHVTIRAPPCSGSMYHNYKGTFSIVLLAVVDANYCFRMVDVGAYGKGSDGGTLRASAFGKALQAGTLHIPADRSLPW